MLFDEYILRAAYILRITFNVIIGSNLRICKKNYRRFISKSKTINIVASGYHVYNSYERFLVRADVYWISQRLVLGVST